MYGGRDIAVEPTATVSCGLIITRFSLTLLFLCYRNTPEKRSPMKVVAVLRNAGVPFTTQFVVTGYNKGKSYKASQL